MRHLVLALGCVPLIALGSPASAQDGTMRSLLGTLGLIDQQKDPIEYRERAPLVVPNSRALPNPEDSSRVEQGQNWPRDPDAAARAAASADRRGATAQADDRMKVLRESQMRNGPGWRPETSGRPRQPRNENGVNTSAISPGREALMPSELGWTGWGSVFNQQAQGPSDTATFKGEPPRENLTDPPVGLRTPAPTQPYGINTKPADQPNPLSRMFSGWGVGGSGTR
jgi:hypothetical protein